MAGLDKAMKGRSTRKSAESRNDNFGAIPRSAKFCDDEIVPTSHKNMAIPRKSAESPHDSTPPQDSMKRDSTALHDSIKHDSANLASSKEQWFERDEAASAFWLNVTIILVRFLPHFVLKVVIAFVTFIYFIFSKDERENLKRFYAIARDYHKATSPLKPLPKTLQKPNIYLNFYQFGCAICDKVAAWIGKIGFEDITIKNLDFVISEFISGKRGQILLMSHFGNVEVANAMARHFENLNITAFVYQKNSKDFLEMLEKVSSHKVPKIFVDDIDVAKLLELKAILDSGGHIAIMGDRAAINSKRNMQVDFLGKTCVFPCGAFIIAYLLKANISSLWCEKISGKYHIELENLYHNNWHSAPRDSAITPLLKRYVASLEKHALNNPTQWFSFYDFWGESAKDSSK